MSDRPYDCELEYLESTGTQYIDTFLVPNTNLTLTATFGITINSNFDDSGSIFISGRSTTSINVLSIMIRKKNLIYVDSVDGRKNMSVSPNITSTGTYTISLGTTTATLSGDSTGSVEFNGANASGSNSILIFRDRAVGYARTNIKLYSLKIWNSGSLVLDMTPVLKDGVGYMYDKVSRTLFGNAGTGSFVLGPRVGPMFEPPSHVRRLEYLESTGTQYVDTGIQLTSSDRVECRFALTDISGAPERFNGQNGTNLRFAFGKGGTNANFYAGLGDLNYWTSFPLDTDVHDLVLDASTKTVAIDGMSWPVNWTTFATPTGTANWSLFARTSIPSGTMSAYAEERVYSARILAAGVLVRDFRPIRVGTEGALYDRVTDTVFRSATSTPLVAGPDASHPAG